MAVYPQVLARCAPRLARCTPSAARPGRRSRRQHHHPSACGQRGLPWPHQGRPQTFTISILL